MSERGPAGNLRSGGGLPSAEVDAGGKVYVVWFDCRFRNGCATDDIVMSTSTDGKNWSSVVRIPIDGTNSGVEHMIPGIGVDRSTQGNSAHLGLTYYFYPTNNCNSSTCQLTVGYTSSTDGGSNWSNAITVAGPMVEEFILGNGQSNDADWSRFFDIGAAEREESSQPAQ